MSAHPLIAQLRAARQAAGLSQVAVADHLYLNRRSVGQWESGYRTPTLHTLATYADLLGYQITLTPKEETQ